MTATAAPVAPTGRRRPARPWTARQAGYKGWTTVHADLTNGWTQQYVETRHGWVARTWVGVGVAEVVLRRPRNAGATVQGAVYCVPGGWQAMDTRGSEPVPVGPVCVDYLDAEAQLLPLRTGVPARGRYFWPPW